ncbi:hypothetical protein M441DRAFT_45014 [Trichoderma asperellum CBS 433.97]|uniref:NACHT domain-containing protein n=1 Tax=Trichoderma asperellum (strain ATCC 204424 / CBS 433.97 / NBRC 101777) TaxID=1042311 RepID=A0A2T3ZDW3_TRIA4|nr:hypothetical protein M441DRAFT_45014 [Trichoderma asperellum CBS 433.97]PTB43001.1 hypothetical protein M441DRAFT_45014 [Trichoderma asperellum CBS 433.97]
MDNIRSELVLLLAGITGVVFTWLCLSTGNKRSSMPSNSSRRSLAFRISSIPRRVDKDGFRDILTRLPIKAEGTASQLKWTLTGFSYSHSAATAHAERYAVATATFANAPSPSELETAIKREIGIDASRLKVDLDFFGLTPLADPLHDIAVDIIAVTGLAGHAFGSWKSKKEPDMWLRDFLPEAVPNARILTYGYDTKLPGSQSESSIPDLSRRLLESIKTIRSGHTRNRPLILIGHSLGGLVVKEALAEASEGSEDDQSVFRSCYAVLLFAVPNRGLENSSLMYMVKGQPNEDLVKDLKQSSRFLNMLSQRFNKYFTLDGSKIISIYETKRTPTVKWCSETASWERTGSKIMMVPFTSAIHAGPNEKVYDQISIEADHSEIVKFSDISNHDYLIIESRIRDLVAEAPIVIQERFAQLRRKLSDSEKRYIEALKAPDYYAFRINKVDKPTPGTLSWFLKHELVQPWLSTPESSALWVYGAPGQGKTILAKFLLDYLEELSDNSSHRTTVIYFFFYNQDDNYSTISAALKAFIKQLISAPHAFQSISDKFNLETSTITDESMWAILEALLHSSIFDTVYCVIDALDECQDLEARQRLLGLIETLVQPPLMRKREKCTSLKAFLTSRPTVVLGRSLKGFPSIQLKASPDDLKVFILGKIQNIGLPAELERRAIDLLSSRVEQTFLWISIILKKLRTVTTLLSEADMEQIINESPSDLTELYESIVNQIMQSNDKVTQKLLIWTVFGRRALTLNELEDALAIQEDSKSIESIRKYRIQDLTDSKITSAAGIILEIVNGKVYLIHQSAKDFLLESEHLAKAVFCRGLRPGIYLAKTCMTYLCFTDFVETGPCQDSAQLDERIRHYPFFHYAARNWHRHIRIDDDINIFTSIISQLTKPHSPELLAWGEAAGIANLDEAENAWDIATMANIPWLAEFQSRYDVITEEMINEAASRGYAGYNFIKSLTGKPSVRLTEGAVYAAAKYFDHTTIHQLLDKDASVIITPALIEAAAANQKYGRLVMDLLLDLLLESQDRFIVTAELVQLAAENHENGRDIVELLMHKEDTDISEGAIAAIAARFSVETMRILMNLREDIKVTKAVIEAAIGRRYDRDEMVIFLLEQQDQDFRTTETLIPTIARDFDKKIMELLLEKHDQNIQITEEVVEATRRNLENAKELMKLFLSWRGDSSTITKGALVTIVKEFNKEVVTLLLDRQGDEITITEEVIEAAAGNESGKNNMELLLDRRGDEITITEEVVKAAAGSWCGESTMTLLLDRRGDEIIITEKVIEAAAGNRDRVLKLLLDRRGDEIKITEKVIKAAAGNPYGKRNIILLLDRRGDEVTITEEVLEVVAGNGEGKDIMALLLDRRGDEITITEKIIKAVIENRYSGWDMMNLLHDRLDLITMTEEAVKALATWKEQYITYQ